MKLYKSKKAKKHILDTYDQLLDLWNVTKEEMDIPTTYGATHVILCGKEDNPPLILFHGVGDNSALMWVFNAETLSRYFRIIAVDTIGGPGKSVPNENYNSSFNDAIWIDEILNGLNLSEVNIAGVSNGAYLAQYYGVHRSDRVVKILCMAGSVPVAGSNPMKTMIKIFLPEALIPTKVNTKKLICKLCGINSTIFTDNVIIMEHYQALLSGFNNMAMRFHKVEGFSDFQIEAIREKTLYLVGDSDPFLVLGGKQTLIEHKMNARFFPDVGHGINHEISEKINEIITNYFCSS